MADCGLAVPYELANSEGIAVAMKWGTPFGGKPQPQYLPQYFNDVYGGAYGTVMQQLQGSLVLKQLQQKGSLQNNGGNGNMANKYKKDDIVVFIKPLSSIIKAGCKARVRSGAPIGGCLNLDLSYENRNWSTAYWTNMDLFELFVEESALPKTHVDFDSVVISDHKREQILEALEQVNQQKLIFETWGFGETIEKGRGVSMLFYGPPGTGKTLMAQAIANKHKMKLKVIATADVESSAPGEAERNIRKHFEDAKREKAILLFDECDSLIYTRQNVGPIMGAQVNELLSQIERFEGITIFTTNRLGTLDEAVNRRLALKLEFDMPTRDQRAEIWQRMFPKKAPLEDSIDWMRLAIVEITGGYIKNCVLRAARMAAAQKLPDKEKIITMAHLVKSARLETESMMEFEDARAEQEGKIGQVIHGVSTGTGRGIHRAMEKKSMVKDEDND